MQFEWKAMGHHPLPRADPAPVISRSVPKPTTSTAPISGSPPSPSDSDPDYVPEEETYQAPQTYLSRHEDESPFVQENDMISPSYLESQQDPSSVMYSQRSVISPELARSLSPPPRRNTKDDEENGDSMMMLGMDF